MRSGDLADRLANSHIPALQCVGRDLRKFISLCEIDVEMAMVRARRLIELVVTAACEHVGVIVGTKSLEVLMSELSRNGGLPEIINRHMRTVRDFGNLAAHAARADGQDNQEIYDITESELTVCEASLAAVLRWFETTLAPALAAVSPFVTVEGTAITAAMIEEAVELDALFYGEDYRGTMTTCAAWFARNPEIYVMLVYRRTGRVVGYINAMPLEDEYFGKIASGETIDMVLPAVAIRRYDFPDFYQLYLSSIVVAPEFHGSAAFKALFDGCTQKLLRLAQSDVFIRDVIADAVTQQGEQVARTIGMKPLRKSAHGSTIYGMSMLPPAMMYPSRSGQSLSTFYSKKYEEIREVLLLSAS